MLPPDTPYAAPALIRYVAADIDTHHAMFIAAIIILCRLPRYHGDTPPRPRR